MSLLTGVERLLVLGRRNVADRFQKAVVVEPPNPFQRRELYVLEGAPRPLAPNHLRLEEADHVDSVNWDRVCLRTDTPGAWPLRRTVVLANPLTGRGAAADAAFGQARRLDDIVDTLEAGEPRPRRLLAAPKGRGIDEHS